MSFDQPRRGRSVNNDDLKEGGEGGGGMDNGGGNMGGGMGGNNGGQNQQRGNQRNAAPAAVVAPAAAVVAVDPNATVKADGNWEYTVESPQGANGGTIKITKEGETYSGVIINARFNRETPLKNIKVTGNELSFSYEVSFGGNTSEIQVKGIITGDQFAGTTTMQFGSFPMTAKRAQ